jgi:hypothetical protein
MEHEPVASVVGDWSVAAFFMAAAVTWSISLFRAWRSQDPVRPMTRFEVLLGDRAGRNMRRGAVGFALFSFGVSFTMAITALSHAGELSAHTMDALSLAAGGCVVVSIVLIAVLATFAWPRALVPPALRKKGHHHQHVSGES